MPLSENPFFGPVMQSIDMIAAMNEQKQREQRQEEYRRADYERDVEMLNTRMEKQQELGQEESLRKTNEQEMGNLQQALQKIKMLGNKAPAGIEEQVSTRINQLIKEGTTPRIGMLGIPGLEEEKEKEQLYDVPENIAKDYPELAFLKGTKLTGKQMADLGIDLARLKEQKIERWQKQKKEKVQEEPKYAVEGQEITDKEIGERVKELKQNAYRWKSTDPVNAKNINNYKKIIGYLQSEHGKGKSDSTATALYSMDEFNPDVDYEKIYKKITKEQKKTKELSIEEQKKQANDMFIHLQAMGIDIKSARKQIKDLFGI